MLEKRRVEIQGVILVYLNVSQVRKQCYNRKEDIIGRRYRRPGSHGEMENRFSTNKRERREGKKYIIRKEIIEFLIWEV